MQKAAPLREPGYPREFRGRGQTEVLDRLSLDRIPRPWHQPRWHWPWQAADLCPPSTARHNLPRWSTADTGQPQPRPGHGTALGDSVHSALLRAQGRESTAEPTQPEIDTALRSGPRAAIPELRAGRADAGRDVTHPPHLQEQPDGAGAHRRRSGHPPRTAPAGGSRARPAASPGPGERARDGPAGNPAPGTPAFPRSARLPPASSPAPTYRPRRCPARYPAPRAAR